MCILVEQEDTITFLKVIVDLFLSLLQKNETDYNINFK